MWDWNPVWLQSDYADPDDFPSVELYLLGLQKGSEPHDKSTLNRRWKRGRIWRKLFSIPMHLMSRIERGYWLASRPRLGWCHTVHRICVSVTDGEVRCEDLDGKSAAHGRVTVVIACCNALLRIGLRCAIHVFDLNFGSSPRNRRRMLDRCWMMISNGTAALNNPRLTWCSDHGVK